MIERKRRKISKRKLGLIITVIDFLIIFIFIFYTKKYYANIIIKHINKNSTTIKFKYFKLKNNIGYMFNLTIMTHKPAILTLNNKGEVLFFIKNNTNTIWKKKSLFTVNNIKKYKIKSNSVIFKMNKDSLIIYNEMYDNFKNKFLKKDKTYTFGSTITINNKKYILEDTTKPKDIF